MITVETFGDAVDQIRQQLVNLTEFRELLPKFGELSMNSQKSNIEESRTPAGEPFDALRNSRPPGHPYGDKPLLDTTAMYQSIAYELRGEREVFAGPSLTQAPYFPNQNQGTDRFVARSFIGIRTEETATAEELAHQHAVDAMAAVI